jgi:hypothetical protein
LTRWFLAIYLINQAKTGLSALELKRHIGGGLTVFLNILHPIEEVFSFDTVRVFPQPEAPLLNAPNGASACAGTSGLVLQSSYGTNNQWLRNGSTIQGATRYGVLSYAKWLLSSKNNHVEWLCGDFRLHLHRVFSPPRQSGVV